MSKEEMKRSYVKPGECMCIDTVCAHICALRDELMPAYAAIPTRTLRLAEASTAEVLSLLLLWVFGTEGGYALRAGEGRR